MNPLDELSAEIPEATSDLRVNLRQVLGEGSLTPSDRWGVAIAVALAARSHRVAAALAAARPKEMTRAAFEDAAAAAALMGLTNVYYRFPHQVGKPEYAQRPARLKLQRLARPASTKVSFKLFALAVSTVNACEACVRLHEAALLELGVSETQIHDAVRIAAVVHGVAIALEASTLLREND